MPILVIFLFLFSCTACSNTVLASNSIGLTLGEVQIIEHPKDAIVCAGRSAEFSVKLEKGQNAQFQWQTSVDGLNWLTMPQANLSIYSGLKNVNESYDGLFVRVLVFIEGGAHLVSKSARLFVITKLVCTQQPQAVITVEEGTATFVADFSSKGKTQYQWQLSPYGSGVWFDIFGEQQNTLSIPQLTMTHSGANVRVKAMSEGGCDSILSESAFIEVIRKPLVQLARGLDAHCAGSSATFSIKMQGGSGLEKVQWQESTDKGKTYKNIPHAIELNYTINRILESMAGYKYRALITLPGNVEMYSSEITITVHGAVAFHKQPKPVSYICPGDAIQLKAQAAFKGSKPHVQWQVSKDSLHFSDLENQVSEQLEIRTELEDRETKYYRAVVQAGECQTMISDVAQVVILTIDGIEPKVQDVIISTSDSVAMFRSNFKGSPDIYSCTWQWSANDGASWQTANSNNPEILEVQHITPTSHQGYQFRLKVLNNVCAHIYYSEPAKLYFERPRE